MDVTEITESTIVIKNSPLKTVLFSDLFYYCIL